MRYKIEIIYHEAENLSTPISDENQLIPRYGLYEYKGIRKGWNMICSSTKLKDLMKIANDLKSFKTIYI